MMTHKIAIFAGLVFCVLGLAEEGNVLKKTEEVAVKEAALNYIQGWYEGNVDRMDKALHPDLVKRYMNALPNGREVTHTISKKTMLEYTKAGFGTKATDEEKKITVEILDIHQKIASVKTTSGQFIDYLHLAKTDGEWKIMNVLWMPAKSKK